MEAIELDCSEPMFDDVLIGSFVNMEAHKGEIILTYYNSQGPSSESFQLLDEIKQIELGTYGEVGFGPDNFNNPETAGFSENGDTLYVMEVALNYWHKLVRNKNTGMYNDDFVSKIDFKDFVRLQKVAKLKNGYYVSSVGVGGQNLFVILNQNGNIVKSFGQPPFTGYEGDCQDFFNLRGSFAIHDNGFYYCFQNWAYIVKYNIDENLTPTLVWEKFYDTPIYAIDNSTIKMKSTTRGGFSGIAIADNYVFASYSGVQNKDCTEENEGLEMVPRYIVVFKPDGGVVCKLKINEYISNLAISSDKQFLYCKTYYPDLGIIRIPIMEILKKCKK